MQLRIFWNRFIAFTLTTLWKNRSCWETTQEILFLSYLVFPDKGLYCLTPFRSCHASEYYMVHTLPKNSIIFLLHIYTQTVAITKLTTMFLLPSFFCKKVSEDSSKVPGQVFEINVKTTSRVIEYWLPVQKRNLIGWWFLLTQSLQEYVM